MGALPGEGEREAEEEHADQDQPGGDALLACLFHHDSPLLKRSENFYQLMMGSFVMQLVIREVVLEYDSWCRT